MNESRGPDLQTPILLLKILIIYEDFLGHSSKIYVFRNNTNSIIELDDIPFEKGKYYYFNDIDNSFNIPPMEEGN